MLPPRAFFLTAAAVLLCVLGIILWLRLPASRSLALETPPRTVASTPVEATPSATFPKSVDDESAGKARIADRKSELRAALASAADITDPKKKIETLARLCFQWAEFDPRGAVDLAFDNHLDEAGEGIIENLTQQWAVVDLPAARAWVETQPPGDACTDLVARIGFVWAQTDPAEAAKFVIARTSPGHAQTEAAISVLYQWARRDPAAAREWAQTFPPGELRDRALAEVAGAAGSASEKP
jgi:hypothetical protein